LPPGETMSIADYAGSMKAGQRDIYYLAAPSRQLAESSPYFEALKVSKVLLKSKIHFVLATYVSE